MPDYSMITTSPNVNFSSPYSPSAEYVLNFVIPIFSIVVFIIVLIILYNIDDPGLKEIEALRQQEVELGYKAVARSMREDGGPDPRWPLLSSSIVNTDNSCKEEKRDRYAMNQQSLTVHIGMKGEINVPARRRTFSDSTFDATSVRKSSSETQVLLENFLIRGRKNSGGEIRKSSVRSLKEAYKSKLRGLGNSSTPYDKVDGRQPCLKRLQSEDLHGPIIEETETPDYTDKNYVTIA